SKAGSFNIAASSGVAISNNLFDGGSISGTNAVTGNPLFGSIANANFRLQATSPAINAGTSTGAPTIDFDLKARATDGQVDIGAFEYGSSTTSPLTISDTTPPSVPQNLAATPTNSSTVTLSWSASTDNVSVAGYKVYRDNTEIGTSAVPSFTDTSIVKGTTYNYTIKAYDSAGNLSVSSNTANVQTLQQAINISSYYVNNITSSGATVNWTTNAPSSGRIYYGTSAANLNLSAIFSGLSTSHSVNLTGLIRRTSYYYQIIVKDSAGATVTSTIFNFKTATK
ncbi:MAG: choice-of-anchor Q domain-containing protein, partial [Methylococcales bacterium]|nr:choice-of-anchor Q domain-containing protein [Methylococcales bacterium]